MCSSYEKLTFTTDTPKSSSHSFQPSQKVEHDTGRVINNFSCGSGPSNFRVCSPQELKYVNNSGCDTKQCEEFMKIAHNRESVVENPQHETTVKHSSKSSHWHKQTLGYLYCHTDLKPVHLKYVSNVLNNQSFQNEVFEVNEKGLKKNLIFKMNIPSHIDRGQNRTPVMPVLPKQVQNTIDSSKCMTISPPSQSNNSRVPLASVNTQKMPTVYKLTYEKTPHSSSSQNVSCPRKILLQKLYSVPVQQRRYKDNFNKLAPPNVVMKNCKESAQTIMQFKREYAIKSAVNNILSNQSSHTSRISRAIECKIPDRIESTLEHKITNKSAHKMKNPIGNFSDTKYFNLVQASRCLNFQSLTNKTEDIYNFNMKDLNSTKRIITTDDKEQFKKSTDLKISQSSKLKENNQDKKDVPNRAASSSEEPQKKRTVSSVRNCKGEVKITSVDKVNFPDDELNDLLYNLEDCAFDLKQSCDRIVSEVLVSVHGNTLQLIPANSYLKKNREQALLIADTLKTVSEKIKIVCELYIFVLKKSMDLKEEKASPFKHCANLLNNTKCMFVKVLEFSDKLRAILLKCDITLPEMCKITWLVRRVRAIYSLLERHTLLFRQNFIDKTHGSNINVLNALDQMFVELKAIGSQLDMVEMVKK